jgi:hypothetical protein
VSKSIGTLFLKDNIKQLTLLDSPSFMYSLGSFSFLYDLRLNNVFIDNYSSLVGYPYYLNANVDVNLYNSVLTSACKLLDLSYNPHGYAHEWYISSIDNFSIPYKLCDEKAPFFI